MSKQWPMTDAEIRNSWRRCEDRVAQIRILAELNCKTKPEVIEKLRILGIEVPEDIKRRRIRFTEMDDRKIWQQRIAGDSYRDIAGRLGRITPEMVRIRFFKLLEERRQAQPTLEKALIEYMQSVSCSEDEYKMLQRQLRRGI